MEFTPTLVQDLVSNGAECEGCATVVGMLDLSYCENTDRALCDRCY